jgi:mitochondrial-processing peptidase subunit alpha
VFEDIGQQMIYDDKYLTPREVCEMIDSVTKEDIARVAAEAIMRGPSIASVGNFTHMVPSLDTVKKWFSQ